MPNSRLCPEDYDYDRFLTCQSGSNLLKMNGLGREALWRRADSQRSPGIRRPTPTIRVDHGVEVERVRTLPTEIP